MSIISILDEQLADVRAKEINDHVELNPNIGFCSQYENIKLTSAYQPILKCVGGKVDLYGYEALVRAVDDGANFSPYHFIMGLKGEERQLFDRITRAIHIRNFLLLANHDIKLFLNTDPVNYQNALYQKRSMSLMLTRAMDAGLSINNIVFELMETKSGDNTILKECIFALRKHGISVAVDDYGIDHSSISRVKLMQPDIVKFDRSWLIEGRESNERRENFYKHVREIRVLGIKILVEGVEFEEDLEMVEAIKPEFVQGYWYGKPIKIQDMISDKLPLPNLIHPTYTFDQDIKSSRMKKEA